MSKTVIVTERNDVSQAEALIRQSIKGHESQVCLLLCETLLLHFLDSGLNSIEVRVRGSRRQWVELRAAGPEIDLAIPRGVSEAVHDEMEIGLSIIENHLSMIDLSYAKGTNRCRIYVEPDVSLDLSSEIDDFYRHADAGTAARPMAVLIHLAGRHKGLFTLSMLYKTIRHLGAMMMPVFAANIIDSVVRGCDFFSPQVFLNILGSVLALSANLLGFWAETATYRRLTRAVESGFRMALVKKLQILSMKYHSSVQSGKLLSKLISDVQFIVRLITDRLQDVLHVIIDVIILIIMSLMRFPPMLIFYALAVPSVFLFVRDFSKPILKRKMTMRHQTEDANAAFREMLGMNQMTRMHGLEKTEYRKIATKVRRVQTASNAFDDINVTVNNVTFGGFQGFRILCLCVAAYLFTRGYITVGTVILFQSLFDMMINSIQKVLEALPELTQSYDSLVSVNEVLCAEDIEQNGTQRLPQPVRGEVELRHVSFEYDAQSGLVLDDISLQIPSGSVVAFVGRSGAGKSTLLNLILGLYKCTEGQILIDGIDICELDKNDYRHHVAVVPQHTALFSGTLWGNLVYGLSYVTRDQMMDVIRRVGLEDLINSLPDGLDSQVLEDGGNLSGGQRQRISIARAMLRNAKFILFDEATSALDAESEQQVQEAIDAMTENSTVIMVAHRLNTLRKADRIYRIEDGKAVLCESFDELIRTSSVMLNQELS